MSDAEAEYVCPGCEAHNMAEDCYHSAQGWEFAEAIRDGVERQHPGTTWSPIEGAFNFVDDAQDVLQDVGEGPWRIEFDHPGGRFASIGLVNGRYLVGIEDGDGEAPCVFIGDIQNLSVALAEANKTIDAIEEWNWTNESIPLYGSLQNILAEYRKKTTS